MRARARVQKCEYAAESAKISRRDREMSRQVPPGRRTRWPSREVSRVAKDPRRTTAGDRATLVAKPIVRVKRLPPRPRDSLPVAPSLPNSLPTALKDDLVSSRLVLSRARAIAGFPSRLLKVVSPKPLAFDAFT